MKPPVQMILHFTSIMDRNAQVGYMFATADLAKAAFDKLATAQKSYNDRANDRERNVTFSHLSGEACVDVSSLTAYGYDDAFGGAQAMIELWNTSLAEMTGRSQGAHERAKLAGDPA